MIQRAVASVTAQTRPATEIVLVDDASGDETAVVLERLAASCGPVRIHVVKLNENGGPGLARNKGWELAQGNLIAFLDADDVWHPQKLEVQVGWMERNPDVMLTGHRSTQLTEVPEHWSTVTHPCADAVTVRGLLVSNPLPTRSVVLRRDLPLRFSALRHSEDFKLWLEIVARGHRVSVLDQVLAYSLRPDFSAGGLSGQLLQHEMKELYVLADVRRQGLISLPSYFAASCWSLLKFGRRLVITMWRSITRK